MSKNNTPVAIPASPKKETKTAPFLELKMDEDGNGGFSGIGSPFLFVDDGGDIVMPGAYKGTIESFLDGGFNVDSHGWSYKDAVGYPVSAEEKAEGLYFESKFHGTEDAQSVRQKMRERIEAKKKVFYSIGYYTRSAEIVSQEKIDEVLGDVLDDAELEKARQAAGKFGAVRLLKELELAEISVVMRPMATAAQATSVKSAGAVETAAHGETDDTEEKNDGERQDGTPLRKRQDDALAAVSDVIERWSEIGDLCLKEGRAISSARRKRLKGLRDHLAAGVGELDALLEETEPEPKQEQKPDTKADKDSLWLERERARTTAARLRLHG